MTSAGEITGSQVLFTAGKIGGFNIFQTKIYSANNDLELKSNGQITGSNVLFDGGTLGGFAITNNAVSSSATIAGLGSPLQLKSNGEITGSAVLIKQRIDGTNYTLMDTAKGILDARNLGRQVVSDLNEYSITGNGSNTYQDKQYYVFPILPNETDMMIGYHFATSKGAASSVQGKLRFIIQTGSNAGGVENNWNNYDDWGGDQVVDELTLTTAATFPSRAQYSSPGSSVYANSVPDGFDGKLCRLVLQLTNNVLGGTANSGTIVKVKNISVLTTREFSSDFAESGGITVDVGQSN